MSGDDGMWPKVPTHEPGEHRPKKSSGKIHDRRLAALRREYEQEIIAKRRMAVEVPVVKKTEPRNNPLLIFYTASS